jgi:hypothetical protein
MTPGQTPGFTCPGRENCLGSHAACPRHFDQDIRSIAASPLVTTNLGGLHCHRFARDDCVPGDALNERTMIRKIIDKWNAANSLTSKVPTGWDTHASPLLVRSLTQLGSVEQLQRQCPHNVDEVG